jgi:uncharacterized RDD family membrane protein YckC
VARSETGPVSLLRRLGAALYDSLLLLAIWMVIALLFLPLGEIAGRTLIPLQFGANLIAAWLFFTWFWTRTGQTLGMQTWNIRLLTDEGAPVNRWRATLRYLVALAQWLTLLLAVHLARQHGAVVTIPATALLLLGIGLTQLHPSRLMLHDWLSRTVLVRSSARAFPP